jgi:signal transduction histidine kinase
MVGRSLLKAYATSCPAPIDRPTPSIEGRSAAGPGVGRLSAAGGLQRGYLPTLILLIGAYYGAAHIGYALQFAGPVAAILWLPVGVGVAFLYLGGLRFWPGVVVGDLLVNNYDALPLSSAIGQTAGNLLEVVVAVLLMRCLVRRGSPFDSVRGLTSLLVAIAAGTAVSATIGCISLRIGDVLSTSALPKIWRTWWLGDFAGALLVVPLALAWVRPRWPQWDRARVLEAIIMLGAVAGLSEIAARGGRPLTYVVFPALIWAALRFGPRGATVAVAISAGFAVWDTTHFIGPFAVHSVSRSDLNIQLYIGVSALATFCLAAVVSEREEFANGLAASRARLIEATDAERTRLERNLHDGAQGRLAALLVRFGVQSEQARASPETTAFLTDARSELTQALEELRELSHGIQPGLLTRFGLARAVEGLAARSSIPIDVLELPDERFDERAEATAYYVLAEALTNAHKHARASSLRIRARARPRRLSLEVVDDGTGGATEEGFGLSRLRDRVEATGGSFTVHSPVGVGTRITAEIPITSVSVPPPP